MPVLDESAEGNGCRKLLELCKAFDRQNVRALECLGFALELCLIGDRVQLVGNGFSCAFAEVDEMPGLPSTPAPVFQDLALDDRPP